MKRLLCMIMCMFALFGCTKDTPKRYEIKIEEGTIRKADDKLIITFYELDNAGECVRTDYFFLKDGMSRTITSADDAVRVKIRVKGELYIKGKVDAYCTEVMRLDTKKTASMTIKWNTPFEE